MLRLLFIFLTLNRKARGMNDVYEDIYWVEIERDRKTNNVTLELWRNKNGEFCRINGPAEQRFDPISGQKIKEVYRFRGQIHREEEDGAAVTYWDAKTGNITHEEYGQYGVCNRSNGQPALVDYDANSGEIINAHYVVEGVDIDPKTGEPLWDDPMIGEMPQPN